MGATTAQVGWLAALPALVNIVWLLPAARIIERQRRRLPLILWSGLLQRLGYLLMAVMPLLIVAGRVEALIVINDHTADAHVTAPKDAYRMLFEGILTSHLARHCKDSEMTITLTNPEPGALKVSFETIFDGCMPVEAVQSTCSIFTEHLSDKLGKIVTKNMAIEDDRLITELTLKR
jgi:hypothetical protein